MSLRFEAVQAPDLPRQREIEQLEPANPFHTAAYAEAMQGTGAQSWLFTLSDGATVRTGCVGFLTRGRLSVSLEIVSLPHLAEPSAFWDGLKAFCRSQGILSLSINTFASPLSQIPRLGIEQMRIPRSEFIVALDQDRKMSTNHRRNIKRATKAGVEIVRIDEPGAAAIHSQLISRSMSRRRERGEEVDTNSSEASARRYLESGSGCLFQARLAGKSVSSILMLVAAKGAYYHSAGSNAEGLNSGAPSLLISEVAEQLKREGKETLNLGGTVASQTGLIRFKSGFGAREIHLEAATFFLGSRVRMHVLKAVSKARVPWKSLLASNG